VELGSKSTIYFLVVTCAEVRAQKTQKNLRLFQMGWMVKRCIESIAQSDGWAQCTNTRSSREASATVNALSRAYIAQNCRVEYISPVSPFYKDVMRRTCKMTACQPEAAIKHRSYSDNT
jgi:hypothetical protein